MKRQLLRRARNAKREEREMAAYNKAMKHYKTKRAMYDNPDQILEITDVHFETGNG